MASRRMFSKDVVCSDRFLDMPASAQALYFQYGLEADDDGFVSAPKKILRLTNASDDDLKILVAKGFLIPFDSGVVVIRDWKINNYLRRDRYTPTRFKEEFEQLDTIDDRYQLHVLAVGIPDDNHVVDMRDTQVRLGSKARAAKEDLEKLSQEEGKLADMHNKLQTAYDGVNDKINEYSQKADEATASTSRLSRIGGMVGKAIGSIATFGKNAAKSLTGAKKSSSGFGLSLGTLVKYGFGIRSLYVLVNKLRSALVDGFKNLSQYSGETNGSISMLWSSLERLKNSLATAFAPILTVVAPILSKFIDIGNLIAQGASEAYQYFEDKIKEAGGNVVDGILLGILDALLGIGSWIVDNVFKPILDGFKNAFGIHSPSTVMQEQGHYIIEGLLLGITDFLSKIKKKFEEIRNLVTEKMDNIKSSAVSKVNEMKKGLSDGVERIKESFRSGFSTLVGYVKSPINSIIRFINNFLYAIQTMQNSFANALNSMSISLPHWLEKLTGFSSVGFNVGYWSAPMVPYLAQGAVIPPNKEFMAVLGDQKSGNNIEAPESLIRRIVREESGNGKGSTYNVTAQVNRRTLFDLVLEEGKVRRTVTGRNPFETV